jgi:hypothetical protein
MFARAGDFQPGGVFLPLVSVGRLIGVNEHQSPRSDAARPFVL